MLVIKGGRGSKMPDFKCSSYIAKHPKRDISLLMTAWRDQFIVLWNIVKRSIFWEMLRSNRAHNFRSFRLYILRIILTWKFSKSRLGSNIVVINLWSNRRGKYNINHRKRELKTYCTRGNSNSTCISTRIRWTQVSMRWTRIVRECHEGIREYSKEKAS